MKKLLIVALSLGLMAPVAAQIVKQQATQQQQRKKVNLTPEKYAERKVAVLDQQVQLTAEQKTKLYDMYKSTAPKRIGAIGTDAKTISEVNQMEQENTMKVLTTSQKDKLKAIQAERLVKQKEIQSKRQIHRSDDVNLERAPLTNELTK